MAALGGFQPLFLLGHGTRIITNTLTAFAVDAANDGVGYVFTAPPSGPTLTKCAIRPHALTGSSPTYVVSLQGVDLSTGFADGTIKGGASPVSVEITPAARVAATVVEYTFANSYDSAPGELLALCIYPKAGTTIDGSNFWTFTRYWGGAQPFAGVPYCYSDTAGTKSKGSSGGCFAVGDGTTWYGGDCPFLDGNTYSQPNDSGTPVFAGNYFTIPAAAGDTVSCVGFWINLTYTASATAFKVALYDASDNLLADTSVDKDVAYTGCFYWDSAAVALTCGSAYRLVVQGVGALFRLGKVTFSQAAHLDTQPWGQNCCHTEGSTGSWAQTTTARSMIGPLISDITEPTASGGLLRHPGMTGGILG